MTISVLLVDAYAAIYRAFFAIRTLTGPRGEPVNAIYGFTKMLRKLLADHCPSHCAVVFDQGVPQYRLTILPSYKQQRPPTPPELDAQLPSIRGVLAALRIPIIEIDGEEADDIIATLAVRSVAAGADVLIASHDKDFMQIVAPHVRLIRTNGKETAVIDEVGVESRYGVKPKQMVDFLSLVGDPADNIRGVAGVGEKTAAELLRKYKTAETLLASVSQIDKPRLREAIRASADRTLAATLDDLKLQAPDYPKLSALFKQLGFKSLLAEVDNASSSLGNLSLFAETMPRKPISS